MIQTKDLHIGYKSSLLQVKDLYLESGLYILVGKNGSGKSTFLKTLTGELTPYSGSVIINNKDVHQLSPTELPQHVAFVSTRFPYVDFLRVEEYISLGRSPHTAFFGKLSNKDKELTNDAINTLQIEHLRNRFTSELSDGEKQLVSIARAFAQQSPIIALDEPTAFLDYSNKSRILTLLNSLAKEHNKCIVLSSHDLELNLEVGCPFLVVDTIKKQLQLHLSIASKEDLLKYVL